MLTKQAAALRNLLHLLKLIYLLLLQNFLSSLKYPFPCL